jgi:transcriptional regulator with XRE-family HTH domain
MANERLRTAIGAAGWTLEKLAVEVGVDFKTAERWINAGRTPHRTSRRKVAELLSIDELHLWPDLAGDLRASPPSDTEVVTVFPTRSAVPHSLWIDLINSVSVEMDVLVFSGTFLVEQYNLLPILRNKSSEGVRFRLMVGDETSSAVIQRGIEEGTTGGLEGRVQLMRRYLDEVASLPGVDVRAHGTPLYNSIYRFDNQMLVNGHAFGSLAGQNPVLYLRRLDGGLMWDHYLRSFERVWESADNGAH